MKKFIALVVVLCAVMISSSASAETFKEIMSQYGYNPPEEPEPGEAHARYVRDKFLSNIESEFRKAGFKPLEQKEPEHIPLSRTISSFSDLYIEDATQRAEREKLKKETERRNELFQLVFSITLAIWLIAIFFFYKYKNRQSGGEQSFRSWLSSFAEIKNFWILIFCVVSLVTCVIYVPYNLVRPSNPDIAIKSAHATIFDIPKDFKPQLTKIDYQAIAFREVLILLGCCVGYLGSTMIKKK